jgi:GNAT superfamily N-acetyltransferase
MGVNPEDPMERAFRTAGADDADDLARLVNLAYEAERFFVEGDRTNADEIRAEMAAGTFLVAGAPGDRLVGCVHVTTAREPAAFGMLAVHPAEQGRGLGRGLIRAAEALAAEAGRRAMEIYVVNLRTDLLSIYTRLGYRAVGEAPYVHRPTTRPCHFVVMRREL